MKLKIFLIRNLAVLIMLATMAVSLILALIMFFNCSGNSGVPLMMFGDELLPLMFFIPALFFRSRFCALAAIITSFLNIILRLAAIILYKETFMPLDYHSVKLLLLHTDMQSLQAALGTDILMWLLPMAGAGIAGIIYCCALTWKTAGKSSRKVSRRWLYFFSFLLLLSLTSNLLFQIVKNSPASPFIRPLPLVSAKFAGETLRDISNSGIITPVPLPEKSRKILTARKIIPDQEEISDDQCLFDRIIIIATESLDRSFVRQYNSAMPEDITPNLDHFARNYPSLENYFASAQPTSWGLTAMLMSRFDYEKEQLMKNPSLFSVARVRGFHSAYFSAASGFFGNNRMIYNRLFSPDICFFYEELSDRYQLKAEHPWGLSDQALFNAVFSELKKIRKKRFIALISTMDTHPLYFSRDLSEADKQRFNTPFLQALHNTDREIGNFVRRIMSDRELFNEKTLIIITADHTATHGENYLNRTDFLPERIPLIFISSRPEVFKNLQTDKFASSIDLAPTLLKLTGCQIPESFAGNSLFAGKNLAISRLFGDILLLRSPEIPALEINIKLPADDEERKLFCEFYQSLYGK